MMAADAWHHSIASLGRQAQKTDARSSRPLTDMPARRAIGAARPERSDSAGPASFVHVRFKLNRRMRQIVSSARIVCGEPVPTPGSKSGGRRHQKMP